MHLECVVPVCAFVEKRLMADFKEAFKKAFRQKFQLILSHPEVAVNNRHCRELFLSNYYQRNVVLVLAMRCIAS